MAYSLKLPCARILLALSLCVALFGAPAAAQPAPQRIQVRTDLTAAGFRAAFRPDTALGAGVDGAMKGDIDRLFTPRNIAAMRSLGLRSLTYRLRTELGVEAWHWTEEGTWSDPAHSQGYWTSSDHPQKPIQLSWGYELPRRGDTQDNANNSSWSRLTDGDPATFWKSNPYLDPRYTHERAARPQWLIVRLDEATPIDAVQIAWGDPYATAYEVQYWTGVDDYDLDGRWVTFATGAVTGGRGGTELRRLATSPVTAQYLRILLKQASGTAPPGSTDVRDGLGYAVREVGFGTLQADGFHDAVRHAASHDDQTYTHVSSTDPWHRAIDRDPNLEQVGVDRVFASGLGNGLPVMMPVGVLFDTPENAAALVRYLVRRGYPVDRIELGEEPDGQFGDPADYGALYLETLDKLRPISPRIAYGGPSMQSAATEQVLVDGKERSWNRAFIAYLKARGRLKDLQFFSFEHYPFDDICGDIHGKLVAEDEMLEGMLGRLRAEGLPKQAPLVISEYGFSAFSGQAMVEMPSALLQADIVGHFLSQGGSTAYMFGYGPNWPINQHLPCAGYGNMAPFLADPQGQAADPLPSFYTSRLLTSVWLQPGHGLHRLYAARVEGLPASQAGRVVAYAALRPDGRLATLVLNRSPERTFSMRIDAAADVHQYGPAQYRWRADGAQGRPALDLPPAHWRAASGADVVLPADGLTVIVSRPTAAPRRPAS
jgi:hypothetical protein